MGLRGQSDHATHCTLPQTRPCDRPAVDSLHVSSNKFNKIDSEAGAVIGQSMVSLATTYILLISS